MLASSSAFAGSCTAEQVLADPENDQTVAGDAKQDIRSVSLAEPFFAPDASKLVFIMKVANLSAPLPINGKWKISFTFAGTTHFVAMSTDEFGTVEFEEGTTAGSLDTTEGPADPASNYNPDGTISIVVENSKVGSPAKANTLGTISAITQKLIGVSFVGGGLAVVDNSTNQTGTKQYTLIGNAACGSGGPTPAPTAAPSVPPGTPRYHTFAAPPGMGNGAAEPTLGPGRLNLPNQPASSGGPTMYIAGLETLRVSWDDCSSPAGALWENKTPPTTPPTTLDPILFTDFGAGRTSPARTFVSQLAGKTSFLAYSDDNGQSYLQSQGSGINSGVDHQTIGGGPYRTNANPPARPQNPLLYPNAIYYASQDLAVAQMARSDDGGQTFGPAVPMYNLSQCGGLHGQIKVAPDGTVYVPNKNCGGKQTVVVSENNGVTFSIRSVPGTTSNDNDPSVGIDSDGTLYIAMQNGNGRPLAAVSNDRGVTWSTPTDIGVAFSLRNCVFPTAVGGSTGRGAVQFLATDEPGDYEASLAFKGAWHSYASHTFDGGATWTTVRVTPEDDPVQRGSICTSGTTDCLENAVGGADRNLLDFNDLEIDHEGRLLVAFADGCVGCVKPDGSDSRSEKATIARQSGGKRMLAQFDPVVPSVPAAPAIGGGLSEDGTVAMLTWSVPDPGDSPITAYNVYRREGEAGSFVLLATVADTKYNDAAFNPATPNFYRVSAVNGQGEGPACRDFKPEFVVPPNPCALPGVLVANDIKPDGTDNDGGANTPPDPRVNVRQLFVAEPDFGVDARKLVFTVQLAPSTTPSVPPSSQWYIIWQRLNPDADFDRYYVAMTSDATGSLSYQYGKFGVPLVGGPDANPNANTPVKLGDADAGTYDPVAGVITITLSNSKAENISAGQSLAKISVRTYLTRPEPGPKALNNASDATNEFDYKLFGNEFCRPSTAPIAALTADPQSGPAPLTVNFSAAASNDRDPGDSIASYAFEFGDGSAPVEQSGPTVQHTYNNPGGYAATVRVKDSRGVFSENAGRAVIEVTDANPSPTPQPTVVPSPTPDPSATPGASPSPTPPTAQISRLLNISTRVRVQGDDNVLIGGFIITGSDPKRVLLRAIGPSMKVDGNGIAGRLEDTTLELRDRDGFLIAFNDDWKDSADRSDIEGSGLAPEDEREAVITRVLSAGVYTAIVRGKDDSTGIGLVEAYDRGTVGNAQLGNISTRGFVETGDNVLIGGFIVGAQEVGTRVLVRALGPSLDQVANALADPTIELVDQNGVTVRANDNWKDSEQRAEIEATGVPPKDDREAAAISPVTPAPYTAILRGKDDTSGVALVEVYNVGPPAGSE